MASLPELSLGPRSYSVLLKSFGPENAETADQTQKLEEFLSHLEEERLKIEAFKRELPLCMHLLNNAVEVYRQQLQAYRGKTNNHNQTAKPVLEEFIPIKNLNIESSQEKISDKAIWMTSAQLWSQTAPVVAVTGNSAGDTKPKVSSPSVQESTEIALTGSQLGLDIAAQRNSGALTQFSKDITLVPELALSSPSDDPKEVMEDIKKGENGGGGGGGDEQENGRGQIGNFGDGMNNNNGNKMGSSNGPTAGQNHRKARRCWSPDLHRRFVTALQMLGGSQVATPKQIRELMKVDGLTNDEVKSHLQKYRLHTRRPSPSPQTPGGPGPQLVVLGGIWVPPEYAANHGGATTLYHHHHSMAAATSAVHHPPPHFYTQAQEFYNTTAAAAPPLPPPLHHQFRPYTTVASSSDGTAGGGERPAAESVEEGKSGSGSWKAGGENDGGGRGENCGGEGKGLAALKEEGEESNGSEITLKF